jgi:hypothetical protein
LTLRWFVVAQAAAIEREGWLPALRRSARLVSGYYGYVFLFFIYVALLAGAPVLLIGLAFDDDSTTVFSFLVGVLVQTFAWSFGALLTAFAYFELRLRYEATHAEDPLSESDSAPVGPPRKDVDSWDPDAYSEVDRPRGWYVDPGNPDRMRYWDAGEPPRWGATTRTPPKIRYAWEEKNRND